MLLGGVIGAPRQGQAGGQGTADALAADCAALTKSVGIAAKTAGKVATDEHTFDLFVEEQALRLDEGMCTRRQGRWWSSLRG